MESIKRGKFGNLLYREVYLAKKDMRLGTILFFAFALFCVLIMISFEHGNIGKFIQYTFGNAETEEARLLNEEKISAMRESIFALMKLLPVMMGCQFLMAGVDVSGRDELVSWQRFARCSPVSPVRRAAAKTVMSLIYLCISIVLAVLYMNIVGAVQGTGVTSGEYALALSVVALMALFCTLGQIYTMILHSTEKGMLALLGTIMVPMWIFAFVNGMGKHNEEIEMNSIIEFCETLMPFLPLIVLGVFALGFAAMYGLYKRREK